jgi:hypothetical protein
MQVEPATLTMSEQEELLDHEAIIEQSQAVFVEVGNALMAIRDERLYRATHESFEAYLHERWPAISKRRGYQLIDSAVIAKTVPIQNERQGRALKNVPVEQAKAAFDAASVATNGQPTAKAIQAALQPDPHLNQWIERGKRLGLDISWNAPFYVITYANGSKAQYSAISSIREAIESAELPPLPDVPGWLIWHDYPMVAMRHRATGYALRGSDAAALIAEATAANRALDLLTTHAWQVTVDAASIGRTDVHAYTALHGRFSVVAAHTLNQLALRAYRAMTEYDMPNIPDDLFDALWLAGWEWDGDEFERNGEMLNPDEETENALWYEAGVQPPTPAAPVAMPPMPESGALSDAEKAALLVHGWAFKTVYLTDYGETLFRFERNGKKGEYNADTWRRILANGDALAADPVTKHDYAAIVAAEPARNQEIETARNYQTRLSVGGYDLSTAKARQQVRQLCGDLLSCLERIDGLPTVFDKAVEAVLTSASDLMTDANYQALVKRLDGVVTQ